MSDADGLAPGVDIKWQSETVGVVEYATDKNQQALFYTKSEPDPQKSALEGRPVFKDTVMVRIAPPGERLNIVIRPAEQRDTRRWPGQWNQFVQNKKQIPDGTPIEMLYPTTPSIGETLKANGVYTIEQCAELSGHAIDNVGMGAQKWVNAAVKYLEVASRGVKASQLQRELDERDGHIRVLERQVTDLSTQVNRLMAMLQGTPQMQETAIAQTALRPQYPAPRPLPRQTYDPQLAQINATSPTAQIQQARAAQERGERRRSRPTLTK
jgi:hypothetical protein